MESDLSPGVELGSILKSEIDGCVRMKSYLQGAPELRLGLSEDLVVGRQGASVYGATVVDDITFHQACNLGKTHFEQ